jgi:hypothetical protein
MPKPELSLLFVRPLNRLGVRYMVTGSVAAILYGEPRFTNDVDFVVFLRADDIRRLHEAFPSPEFYVPPEDVIATEVARESHGHFNIIHSDTGFKADFYPTGRSELSAWAFRNVRRLEFQGEQVVVAPPESVIVSKLEFYKEGHSDKHIRDIRAMLAVSGEQMDRSALNEWIQRRGVEAEWRLVNDL